MNIEDARIYCLSKMNATEDFRLMKLHWLSGWRIRYLQLLILTM